MAAAPLELGRELGTYATFCNLLDMCAIAVPAGEADSGCFGLTLFAPAFHDRVVCDLAHRFLGGPDAASAGSPTASRAGQPPQQARRAGLQPPAIELLVVGAHLSGQPLNAELTRRRGRLLGTVRTAPNYRLYRLASTPPKPGLVRVEASPGRAAPAAGIEGELWTLAPAELASLLADLPEPMTLGRVSLDDGSEVVGFLCEPAALEAAQEITEHGGWLAYLRVR